MKGMRGLALGLGVATLMVVGLACGGGNDVRPASVDFDAPPAANLSGTSVAPPAPAPVFFPKQAPVVGPREVMLALFEGQLVVVDRCLRVNDSGSSTSYLLVWPPEYTVRGAANPIQVLDGAGQVAARVGEQVRVSGGEIKSVRYLDEQVRQTLPADCAGPYWIVGDEVGPSRGPVSTGSMLPRPQSVEELVARADVVFIGTINSVLDEKMMGPYGKDGQPLPAGDDGLPFTDYEVGLKGLLKGHGEVQPGDPLVLRMFGHLSNRSETITPDSFTLPKLGDRLLFALGRNPDGTYGSGPEGLLNISGENVSYADGVPFGVGVSRQQFLKDITRASGAQPPTSEVRGPFDTAWAEVTIVSVEGDMATMKIQELMDYFRYEHATYPELNVGDEIHVRYDTSALRSPSEANSVAMGVELKEGEAPPEIPQPVLIEGERYRAEMSGCFSDGVTSCHFEGWSAAIYPLEQSPRSIAPLEESNTAPPPPTITPLGGARLTAPVPANDLEAPQLELFYDQRQDLVGNLGAVLAENEPETFAGLWIEHKPQFKVVVLFTRGGEEIIRPYIANQPVADFVEVRAASVTLVELQNAQAAANRAGSDLGIAFGSGIDVKENRVELHVTDSQALYKALRGANVELPDRVEVVRVDDLDTAA